MYTEMSGGAFHDGKTRRKKPPPDTAPKL